VKITPGQTTTLAQASDEIRKQLIQETAQSKLVDIANAYTDASSSGLTLAEAAKKVGMHAGHVPAMDKNGLAPDGSKVAVPDDPDFRALVFRTEVGEEGDPQPSKSGHYFVVSVNGLVPPKLKPLDAVRSQAVVDWTTEQRAILLRQKAAQLAAQANTDKSLDAAAKSIGATVQKSQALSHGTDDATFSKDLVGKLFDAMPGQAVFGPKGTTGNYVVARVTGVFHPLPAETDPSYAQGVRLISGGVASGITDTFAAAIKAHDGVTINQKMLNAVVGGEGS
jgi:peptidyl-prolyl cis-trans isomerase D